MERVAGGVIPGASFIFTGRTLKVLPKNFVKVTCIIEANCKSKF